MVFTAEFDGDFRITEFKFVAEKEHSDLARFGDVAGSI